MNQQLHIQDYEVSVHLGCDPVEQKYLQPVRFNFEINFTVPVKAATTDALQDAVDYVKLAEIMNSVAKNKKYHLIEHLGAQVFEALTTYLRSTGLKAEIKLSTQKINVPVENLKNGVVFTCSQNL